MSAAPTARADHVAGPFLRATVLTDARGVDVVLPTDEPVAALLPVLLELLGLPDDGTLRHVTTVDGRVLPPAARLGDTGLRDGVQLRVVAAFEAPSDPVVYDLVDAVEEERPRGEWDEHNRSWGLAAVSAGLVLASGSLAAGAPDVEGPAVLTGVGLLALAASLAATLRQARAVAWVVFAAGWAALAAAVALAAADGWQAWWAVAVPVLLASFAWCAGMPRAAASGVAAWAVLAASAGLTWIATGRAALTAAVVAVVATAVLGLLPRLALATTGAFALDAALGRGQELRRRTVGRAVAAAHVSVLGAVVVTAVAGGVALYLTAVTDPPDAWSVGIALSGSAAWAVRTRHFPLVGERLLVAGAALAGLAGLARLAGSEWPTAGAWLVAGMLFVAALPLVAMVRPPSPLVAANARRWAARVETLAVLAGIPLLVGAFGVYTDLLDSF
ncbi:MAG: EsaB/YukD family protein [Dermatophilaceae bacterium]